MLTNSIRTLLNIILRQYHRRRNVMKRGTAKIHDERAYNGSLGAVPPVGSRGKSPWSGGQRSIAYHQPLK